MDTASENHIEIFGVILTPNGNNEWNGKKESLSIHVTKKYIDKNPIMTVTLKIHNMSASATGWPLNQMALLAANELQDLADEVATIIKTFVKNK